MNLPAFRYFGEDVAGFDADGLRITRTRYAPGDVQPWHAHANPNLHFLLSGSFVDESRGSGERTLEPLSLVFHPAGIAHRTAAGPRGRTGLNIEPGEDWLASHGLSGQDLGRRWTEHDARPAIAIVAFALETGSGRAVGDAVLESFFTPSEGAGETRGWLRRLESRLAADDEVRWSLSTLAADLGVHPVHLARVFRERYGTALTPYLQQRRLLQATRRLRDADCLTTVALEAGYADHAHLSRSFKARFGLTPSQARDRLRNVSIVQA